VLCHRLENTFSWLEQVGVPKIIVFLNKCDMVDDKDMLDLVEAEIRELLTKNGFDGDNAPVIQGFCS